MSTEYATVDFDEIVTFTEQAILFRIDEREVWIPVSVMDPDLDPHAGPNEIEVAEWFAIKEVLI